MVAPERPGDNGEPKPDPKAVLAIVLPSGNFIFTPQPDIAVIELAEVIQALLFGVMAAVKQPRSPRPAGPTDWGLLVPPPVAAQVFDKLSDGAKRHFRFQPASNIVVA